MANDLKLSTVKLVRQLHENPDVNGNERMVLRHKEDLVNLINDVIYEQEKELKFETFEKSIREKLDEQLRFKELKEKERD